MTDAQEPLDLVPLPGSERPERPGFRAHGGLAPDARVDATLVLRRRAELPRAEAIVATGVGEFWAWYEALAVVPTIRDLRDRGEAVRSAEVEKALNRLSHLDPADRETVDQLTRSILNKLLHAPTVRLREAAGNGRGLAVLDSVRYLCELDEHSTHGNPPDEPGSDEQTSPHPNPTRK